jgi:hypothetical protein|tara:strand:- start:1638 stop:1847 length:210 start_codon:yes stop_codon:yes gene_type:complete
MTDKIASLTKPFTESEFFITHAPNFNFEMDSEQLIEHALKEGFIKNSGDDHHYEYVHLNVQQVLPFGDK